MPTPLLNGAQKYYRPIRCFILRHYEDELYAGYGISLNTLRRIRLQQQDRGGILKRGNRNESVGMSIVLGKLAIDAGSKHVTLFGAWFP